MRREILLLWLGVCGVAFAAGESEFLIHNYYVGRVSPDMSPAVASKQYPAERTKRWEPYPRVHVIDIDPVADPAKSPAIRMYLDAAQNSIWLIAISDKRYHTAKGISIGSTFGALRAAHPQLIIRTEEGEMDRSIVAEIRGEGIACQLEYDDATWLKMKAQPDSHDVPASIIPDNKLIQSISVVQHQAPSPGSSDTSE